MKKDKAWLIKRVENYIPLNDKTVGHVVDNILDIIHELDEAEVLSQEWIDEHAFGDWNEYVYAEDLQEVIVPKREVAEEQVMHWIDNNEFYDHETAETVLANAVDKGELGYYGTKYSVVKKPVIPKYVADWIEENVEEVAEWKKTKSG